MKVGTLALGAAWMADGLGHLDRDPMEEGGNHKMRNVLIAAFSLVAFAGSANAAKVKMPNGQTRHTWYQLSGRSATCEVSRP